MKITVCMGSSCFVRGNKTNLEWIEDFVKKHNLSAEIHLTGTRCEGLCAKGPVIRIDDTVYEGVTIEQLPYLLSATLRLNLTQN